MVAPASTRKIGFLPFVTGSTSDFSLGDIKCVMKCFENRVYENVLAIVTIVFVFSILDLITCCITYMTIRCSEKKFQSKV